MKLQHEINPSTSLSYLKMRILSQINDVLELQLIAIKEEDEKVNRGDLKEVFFT